MKGSKHIYIGAGIKVTAPAFMLTDILVCVEGANANTWKAKFLSQAQANHPHALLFAFQRWCQPLAHTACVGTPHCRLVAASAMSRSLHSSTTARAARSPRSCLKSMLEVTPAIVVSLSCQVSQLLRTNAYA